MTSPDVMAALRLMEGGQLREAALKLKQLREGHPDAADVLQAEAMVAMRRGDFVTAERPARLGSTACQASLAKARLGTMHQGR